MEDKIKKMLSKAEQMNDNHKLDNFEHVIYLLGNFIKNEKDTAKNLGGAFHGRIIAYEEILEKLTSGNLNEY